MIVQRLVFASVLGIAGCGHADAPPPETQSSATTTAAASKPDCGDDVDRDAPCNAPTATALPRAGTRCFANSAMFGRMICAANGLSCEELREGAKRVVTNGGGTAEDVKVAVGDCRASYWCATGVVEGKSATACFAEHDACVSQREAMLGAEASGCVHLGE